MIELHNLSICLVEPSNLQANLIAKSLQQIGMEHVSRVANGAEAIKTLDNDVIPDVVMSAMYLPDMTGADLIFTIRQHPTHSSMPFILISSETDPRNLEDIRQAGTIAILPKPFDKSQLLHSVQNTLDFLNAEDEREEYADLKLSSLKLLIVDDSNVARKHIRSVLERVGFQNFTEAVDGKEAIPHIERTLFDLVVTDYHMPNLDGLELTDFIRNRSIQSSVPILMVTTIRDSERLAAVMAAGVSAVFDKSFEIHLMRDFIKEFLIHADY
ncbi:MAG: response regulator [Holophagales bacterium]|jgi:two-component system chemotaxis response regulator CheY|nr:response regulator [Holophagales bacterium]